MIARYSRPEMSSIWEDRYRYRIWFKVEMAVCEELARQGGIPRKDWAELRKKAESLTRAGGVDPKRVNALEAVTRHDVIAFTTAVAEKIGPTSRYIHFGLTSSDVVDTSLSIQVQEAGEILKNDIERLLKVLKAQAVKYKGLATIGRSHGIFAEPTSFGLKFLGWHSEWERNLARLERALENLRYGKLSGAIGVNSHWDPVAEEKILSRLGLRRETVSTQVIPRDRHAELLMTIAIAGSSMERIAVELRHLQRSEVAEVLENFSKGQKGSSAMPHKRNPISSENLTGCARLLRAYGQASLENVALWHERDISHSSVERVVFPDAMILLDYALNRLTDGLSRMVVRKENVKGNLQKAGETVFSGHYLLELVRRGITREQAYAWVQECALKSLESGSSFIQGLSSHPEISRHLSVAEIKRLGSIKYQLKNVDLIFKSALGKKPNNPRIR